MPSSRSVLARALTPSTSGPARALTLGLLLAVSACAGQKGDASKSPRGTSKEDVAEAKKEAQKVAQLNQLIVQANESLQAGRYLTAQGIAEEALSLNPDNPDAHAILGAAAWRSGDFTASTEALRKALEIDPTNYGGALALARNLRAASQYQDSLAVLEPVVAAEAEGFNTKACENLEDCEDIGGWCDTAAKVCKPPVLVESRAGQLSAYYMTLDTERGPAAAEEVFLSGAQAAEALTSMIRGYADYLRAFAGKGELVVIEGETGTSDLGIGLGTGFIHSFAVVGGEPSRVTFSPLQIESRIDPELVATLGLEVIAKIELLGLGEFELTLIPEVEFNGLKIKNVPALISDLESFSFGLPEKAGVLLGHQVMHKLGSIVADHPAQKLTLTKSPPAAVPAGAVERELIILDQWSIHVPATKLSIDGSDHSFWAWLGYASPSAITLTAKAFLKSGHLPREIETPDDEYGRKMVYIDEVAFGGITTPGVGGLVFLEQPGEPTLNGVTSFSGFELGGFINIALLEQLRVTWVLSQGKILVEQPQQPAG